MLVKAELIFWHQLHKF